MKKILFIIIIFLFSISHIKGQNITISSDELVSLRTDLSIKKDSIDSLKKEINLKNDTISDQTKRLSALSLEIDTLKSKIKESDHQIDQLKDDTLDNKNTIRRLNKQNKELKEESEKNIAKLANGRLYFKYDDKRVSESIANLKELESDKIKDQFRQALDLLQNYKDYLDDVKGTLQNLQSIDKNEWRSKHQSEQYKAKCNSILKRSKYYQNVYLKKETGAWSIPYLDNVIDIAKSIILRHNPVESEFANFSPLIEML